MIKSIFDSTDPDVCQYKTIKAVSDELTLTKQSSLLICHINIVSLQKNIDKLEEFLSEFSKKIDIVCLSETRLHEHNVCNVNIPGYNLFYHNSPTRAGGAAIFVSNTLKCAELTYLKLNVSLCEEIWVEVSSSSNENVIIGTMYRQPSSNLFNFEDKFAKSLKTMKARQKYVIFGDFNVDCNKSSSVPSIANYINHINRLGCTQIIDKPTRITHQSQTVIDHIYINSTMIKEINSAVLYYDISDHLPTFANLQFSPSIKSLQRPEIRCISDNKIDSFLSELNCDLNCPEVCASTDIMTLISIMTKLTETYFPKKKMTRKQYKLSKKPWISKEILVSINHQKQLYRYAKTTKNFNTEAVYEYKRYRNKLIHIKEAAKRLYFKKVFNDNACNNPSNTWKYINKVLRKT